MVGNFLIFVYFSISSSSYVHTSIFGNSFQLGYYYVDLWVGTPPVRQTVIIDTGSRLTAFPCMDCPECGTHLDNYFNYKNSSTSAVLTCAESTQCELCASNADLCRYKVSYVEGSSISGYLIKDSIIFGDELNITHSVILTFGCHKKETNQFRTQLVDGIMGLGTKGPAKTIVEVLYKEQETSQNLFTICFANENGYMTIGGYNESRHKDDIQWTSMQSFPFYTISATGLKVNGLDSGLEKSEFSRSNSGGSIIDSGTTFVYLTYSVYRTLYDKFDEFCSVEGKCKGEKVKITGEPHVCFRFDGKLFTPEEFFASFPEISFGFGDAEVVWKPERYLFAWWDMPFDYCVGVYNNGAAENVFGGLFMRGHDVIFDSGKGMMGFVASECGANWNDTFRDRARRVAEEYETKKKNWILLNVVLLVTISIVVYICGDLMEKCKFRSGKVEQESVKSCSIDIVS